MPEMLVTSWSVVCVSYDWFTSTKGVNWNHFGKTRISWKASFGRALFVVGFHLFTPQGSPPSLTLGQRKPPPIHHSCSMHHIGELWPSFIQWIHAIGHANLEWHANLPRAKLLAHTCTIYQQKVVRWYRVKTPVLFSQLCFACLWIIETALPQSYWGYFLVSHFRLISGEIHAFIMVFQLTWYVLEPFIVSFIHSAPHPTPPMLGPPTFKRMRHTSRTAGRTP